MLHLVGADEASRLDLGGEEARRRERAPVLDALGCERAVDAAVPVEDAAARVAERPGVGL
jgi:hypothetical protein